MKITLVFLLCLSVICPPLSAQKGQPGFGKVEKADLEMKDCDFDKGADAMVLIDYGNIYYDRGTVGFSDFKTVFERRTRIKILKEKGISQADVQISLFTNNNEEKIVKITANTYNLDETGSIVISEVKKNAIYTKRIDANYSKLIFTFPEVKVGSIIEYAYTVERETYNLRNWYFQGSLPVRYSEYQLKVPQIFRFSVQALVIDTVEDKHEVINESISLDEGFIDTRSLKSNYVMRNLPGVKYEPFMGSAKDYMQRLEFQMTQIYYSETRVVDLSVKWEDVIRRLNKLEDFGMQLEKTVSAARDLVEEAKQITDAETRMKFIYNSVRKAMSWNGEEDYIYTDKGVSKAWETKTGNVADINLLLINLLNNAGVKATPILFSTRDHGLVSPHYPFINQFNTVMAYVMINNRTFVLDATDKWINPGLIPEKVVNTSGFIVEGDNGKWKEILSGKKRFKIMAAVQGEIDENGNMKGNGLVNSYDYARMERLTDWHEDNQKFRSSYFIERYPALKIEDITLNNEHADSLPLEQKIKFTTALNSSGEYRYFNINLFSGLEKNPFLSDSRTSDVDFAVHREYIIFGNYTIAPGFVFDGLPENISMTTSDNSIVFNRTVQAESNLLNIRMTLEFKKSFYTAGFYPEFKEFYKKLFDKLNEQVVIKKK